VVLASSMVVLLGPIKQHGLCGFDGRGRGLLAGDLQKVKEPLPRLIRPMMLGLPRTTPRFMGLNDDTAAGGTSPFAMGIQSIFAPAVCLISDSRLGAAMERRPPGTQSLWLVAAAATVTRQH